MLEADKKNEFLYQAVQDTQSTIRALDVKSGFIFVVIVQPLLNFGALNTFYKNSIHIGCNFLSVLFFLIIFFWICSLFLLLKTIMPISNPLLNIKERGDKPDCFYLGGLFKLSLLDAFFNCNVQSTKTPKQYIEGFNSSDIEIVLALEKIKLCYIRDVKSKRINYCIWLVFGWILLGLAMYVLVAK